MMSKSACLPPSSEPGALLGLRSVYRVDGGSLQGLHGREAPPELQLAGQAGAGKAHVGARHYGDVVVVECLHQLRLAGEVGRLPGHAGWVVLPHSAEQEMEQLR